MITLIKVKKNKQMTTENNRAQKRRRLASPNDKNGIELPWSGDSYDILDSNNKKKLS